jgi:HAD superfamily hydrolase (TIGR01459 family)
MTFSLHPNMSSLVDHYDSWIIDLWGVIHDGRNTYPGVIECLEQLHQQNKQVIFLSNAPRRSFRAEAVLNRLGISKTLYKTIVTSGEIVFEYIQSGTHNLGNRFVIIGPDSDDGLLDNLDGYTRVTDFKKADFVIATGFDHDDATLKDVLPELEQALAAKLPMICANPDLEVVRQTGVRALCAGVITKHYEKLGGTVLFFGKPYIDVYTKCFELFGKTPKSRIAAIGDNLDTDIAGANQQKIDSYLVTGGILQKKLGNKPGILPPSEKLDMLFKKYDIVPTGVLPAFTW